MKKSLRLLLGTIVLAITVAAASTSSHSQLGAVGTDPVPMCPPGGCSVN